jgi:hypothetical protein
MFYKTIKFKKIVKFHQNLDIKQARTHTHMLCDITRTH